MANRSIAIESLEALAYSEDRLKTLDQLPSNDSDINYYRGVHIQNTKGYAGSKEVEKLAVQSFQRNVLLQRQMLIDLDATQSIDRSSKEGKELETKAWEAARRNGFKPAFVPPAPASQVNNKNTNQTDEYASMYSSVLDQKLIDIKRLGKEEISSNKYSLSGFTEDAALWLSKQTLHKHQKYEFCSNFLSSESHQVGTHLSYHLEHGNPDFSEFTLQQLDDLRSGLFSSVLENGAFVDEYIRKLGPKGYKKWDDIIDLTEKRAYLKKLDSFVSKLPHHYGYRRTVLYYLLDLNLKQKIYDEDLYTAYLMTPRYASYYKPSILAKTRIDHSGFQTTGLLERVFEDDELVMHYLFHFFEQNGTYKPYNKYFHSIKVLYGRFLLWKGQQLPPKIASLINLPSENAEIQLQFSLENANYFGPLDEVNLEVFVKNTPLLLVKVFEINTLGYYLETKEEINVNVNLDGLIANEERKMEFDPNPALRHKVSLSFPNIKKRGVYVFELIGNGKSSRVVVRKGFLRTLHRLSAAGHVFTVLDEANEVIRDAYIQIAGRKFKPDQDGEIRIPFSADHTAKQNMLIVKDDFATLQPFEIARESYELKAGFFVDRESLVAGHPGHLAKLVIRPALYLNDSISLPLSILEEVKLVVKTTDLTSVDTEKEISPFQLHDDKEAVFEFSIPPSLHRISFTLYGKVKSAATGKPIELSSSGDFTINTIDKGNSLHDWHLRKVGKRYILSFLGKGGEPKAKYVASIIFIHRMLKREIEVRMVTNENGELDLGELQDITMIKAGSKSFSLIKDCCVYPSVIHATENEEIKIPYMGTKTKLKPEVASIFEMHNDSVIANVTNKATLANGFIVLRNLPKGEYLVKLPEAKHRITVRVAGSREINRFAISNNVLLELPNRRSLQITNIERNEDGSATIQLDGYTNTTRVHVAATHFIPDFNIGGFLGAELPIPSPGLVYISPPMCSYLDSKTLGEEQSYIINRKQQKARIGNMLPRPSLLLNPYTRKETKSSVQDAKKGGEYASKTIAGGCDMEGGELVNTADASLLKKVSTSNIEFLMKPSKVLCNLKPSDDGSIKLSAGTLDKSQLLTVVAIDRENTVWRYTAQQLKNEKSDTLAQAHYRDVKFKNGLDPNKNYTQKRAISEGLPGIPFTLGNATSSSMQIYDSISKANVLLSTLTNESTSNTLREFSFLIKWDSLSENEKQEKFSKYCCHELNFYLYMKDTVFFQRVVKPYLRNKLYKTFIDNYLIEEDLSDYLALWRFNRLNIVEKILLASRKPEIAGAVVKSITGLSALKAKDATRIFDKIFKTAMNSSNLDEQPDFPFEENEPTKPAPDGEEENLRMIDEVCIAFADLGGLVNEQLALIDCAEAHSESIQMGEAESKKCSNKDKRSKKKERERENEKGLRPTFAFPAYSAPSDIPAPVPATAPPAQYRAQNQAQNQKLDAARSRANQRFNDTKDVALRNEQQQFWRNLDTTQELAETYYYQRDIISDPYLIPANSFWLDFAKHVANNKGERRPFISRNFVYAHSNFTEIIFALAVSDFSFNPPRHEMRKEESHLLIDFQSPAVVFHMETIACVLEAESVLANQYYFDPDEPTQLDPATGVLTEKYIAANEDFLARKVYGVRAVITNISNSQQIVDALMEIPNGAIPVYSGFFTKSEHLTLTAHETKQIEYRFYFPTAGTFTHFPIHIAKKEKLIACAASRKIVVVDSIAELSQQSNVSWSYIAAHATEEQVIEYLNEHPIELLDLNAITWRLGDEKFYKLLLRTLRNNMFFSDNIWSYLTVHKDLEAFRELYLFRSKASSIGPYFKGGMFELDSADLQGIEHLEYDPIVNARVHKLGSERKIMNDRFQEQYRKFLDYLAHVPELNGNHLIAGTYYFLLQDRVEEAQALFNRIKSPDAAETAPVTSSSSTGSLEDKGKEKHKEKKKHKKDKQAESKKGLKKRRSTLSKLTFGLAGKQPSSSPIIVEQKKLSKMECSVQYDYMKAYLDFFNDEPSKAKEIALKYETYPVPRWSKRFKEVLSQLNEAQNIVDKSAADPEDREKKHSQHADAETTIDFSIEGSKLLITYQNVKEVELSIYLMDIEFLFSTNPFVQQTLGHFSYIVPNYKQTIALPEGKTFAFDLPEAYAQTNALIDINANGKRKTVPMYSNRILCNVMENFGHIKVMSKEDGKPLKSVYVKVYSKNSDNSHSFYKDGYTDHRGRFDYVSLNTDQLSKTKKFALLVASDTHGALILEANPPRD